MRDKIVAGNWKMNNDLAQTEDLLSNIKKLYKEKEGVRVIVAPSFTNLHHAFESLRELPVDVAAQNMNENSDGAYTGEVSGQMLTSIGIKTVILGHSERRAIYKETDELLAKKVNAALENDMEVIFCCGEELGERKTEKHFEVVKRQLEKGLFHVPEANWNKVVIAYEPVWAIGTGETASPEQAQEMHAFIRKTVAEKYGNEVANDVAILYGGSVKPGNAQEIFAKEDVDGGLIGGASLKAEDFMAIVEAF
ncbi:triose-phosphate isomerase [Salinimicrobium terrae]|uniref:triose-phosphate isomerase n=1 Tax=Salinimicrobium terrae TaxID=470866 RepID=UPI00041DEC7E|nr:triose-phosphate isomerase [Salinimicrobium terrae]